MKFIGKQTILFLLALNCSFGATKIHIGVPISKYNEGFEIGVNKGILKFDCFEFETGVKTFFIEDEFHILLRKAVPTDIVYFERQRLFYASIPLDILLVFNSDNFKPFLKFGNQFDILVYKQFISRNNADLYNRRMSENPYIFRSGVATGFMVKILSQIFQVDGGLLFGITPFKNGYGGIEKMNILNLNLGYQF